MHMMDTDPPPGRDAPVQPEAQPVVVYIMGLYRSGTTLLGNILGQGPGYTSVGELRAFWRQLQDPDARCGCGKQLRQCEVWSDIADRTLGQAEESLTRARLVKETQLRLFGGRHTWLWLPGVWMHSPLRRGEAARYSAQLRDTYAAVAAVTASRVVVDSSKEPGDAVLVASLPGVVAYFVQIVRDPRGVVSSQLRLSLPRSRAGRALMCAYWSVAWIIANVAAAAVRRWRAPAGHQLLVRYEDLVADPDGVVARVARMTGAGVASGKAGSRGSVRLGPSHTADGNPSRMTTGDIELVIDESWRDSLTPLERRVVWALCRPLTRRYGYR